MTLEFGQFTEPVQIELLPDSRYAKLLLDVTYIDPAGKPWMVPKSFVSDGASIPHAFWSLVGGPWDGEYRSAAMVLDYYCVTRSERSQDVHRMFYFACRAAGVGEIKAKVLYMAVRVGGPRWGDDGPIPALSRQSTLDMILPGAAEPDLSFPHLDPGELAGWVEQHNPSLSEIDGVAVTGL